MKKIFLLIIVFFSVEVSAQQYTPMHLDVGTCWHTKIVGQAPTYCENQFIYSSVGDTIFNNFHYYKIKREAYGISCAIGGPSVDFYFLRNDTLNKKVYLFINNSDFLLYNFNIAIGDTLRKDIWSVPYIVDTIFQKTLYGINYKTYANSNAMLAIHESELIEGLGTLFGFIEYEYGWGFESLRTTMVISYNGFTLFGDSTLACDRLDGVKFITIKNNLSLYPNPSNTSFLISNAVNNNYNIEICNAQGLVVFESKSHDYSYNINCASWPNGIYFVRVGNSVQKFLKQ